MATERIDYVGEELDLFQHATNWKTYFASRLKPYVRGRVLDAGCGMGVNADHLWNPQVTDWTFLEPDPRLLEQVPAHVRTPALAHARRMNGTTSSLAGERFDTILYLDVIEHIEDSADELRRAYELLQNGGHLLILVPAFNHLYSPFDKAIGHFRRYDKRILKAELPPELIRVRTEYLDSLAFFLSLANKWFLKQAAPQLKQVLFWDRTIVPLSRVADPLFLHAFGKSLVAVCRKP
ncbi:MAG: methyltransferase domain-containing protein [Bacteroidetes bacterium]|nr:methyltransferase domain-containing protein [Bacteroidota bacterium]